MNMEWRPEYEIHVAKTSSSGLTSKRVEPASALGSWGIYNHFYTEVTDGKVRVIPRFLFGVKPEIAESMYGPNVADFPVIGVFTESPKFDRIIIQCYMNIVTLSVIFLLYANNPPASVGAKKTN